MPASPGLIRLLAIAAASLAFTASASADVAPDADRVTSLPTLGPVAEQQFAGYSSVSRTQCADLQCSDRAGLFYWLIGKNVPDYQTQPTILWSSGGPGASSFYGALSENGPYTVNADGNLVPYPFSWTSAANYLMFDHPLGTGLSFPFKGRISPNLSVGMTQLYNSLVGVVRRRGLERSPLFLTGESYGGTYMPVLAKRILDGNKSASTRLKLGGVVIVDGWVDPLTQVSSSPVYAFTHGLIDADQKVAVDRILARCRRLMRRPPPSTPKATTVCYSIQDKIHSLSGRYLANIAQFSDIDYQPMIDYLNRPDVREALHAQTAGNYEAGSDAISKAWLRGGMDSYVSTIEELLNRGVPVMVITGLNDAKDTNIIGTREWIAKLGWRRDARYRHAPRTRWHDPGGNVLGYRQAGGGLTTLEVLDAGHLSPRDQPKLIDQIAQLMRGA